jgi:hypothetical protein
MGGWLPLQSFCQHGVLLGTQLLVPAFMLHTLFSVSHLQKGACPSGDACPLAHGVFETWLHPTKFCTVMCTEGTACKRKVCWFAHTPNELRAPSTSVTPSHTHTPVSESVSTCSSPVSGLLQHRLMSPAGMYGSMAGLHNVRRGSAASYNSNSSAGSYSVASSSMYGGTATSSMYGGGASSSTEVSSSNLIGGSSSYYMAKSMASPLPAGPQAQMVLGDSMLTQLQHSSPLLPEPSSMAVAANMLQPLQPGLLPLGSSLPTVPLAPLPAATPSLVAWERQMSPSERLLRQQLQQHQQQQLLQTSSGVGVLSGPLANLSGAGGLADPSAAIPASVMPMLATASEEQLLLDGSNGLTPLSGLVTSLQAQAWQAQLQAANAEAAATAASNNLQAVLSALGGLSVSQPGGVCVDPSAAGQAQLRLTSPGTRTGYPFSLV